MRSPYPPPFPSPPRCCRHAPPHVYTRVSLGYTCTGGAAFLGVRAAQGPTRAPSRLTLGALSRDPPPPPGPPRPPLPGAGGSGVQNPPAAPGPVQVQAAPAPPAPPTRDADTLRQVPRGKGWGRIHAPDRGPSSRGWEWGVCGPRPPLCPLPPLQGCEAFGELPPPPPPGVCRISCGHTMPHNSLRSGEPLPRLGPLPRADPRCFLQGGGRKPGRGRIPPPPRPHPGDPRGWPLRVAGPGGVTPG